MSRLVREHVSTTPGSCLDCPGSMSRLSREHVSTVPGACLDCPGSMSRLPPDHVSAVPGSCLDCPGTMSRLSPDHVSHAPGSCPDLPWVGSRLVLWRKSNGSCIESRLGRGTRRPEAAALGNTPSARSSAWRAGQNRISPSPVGARGRGAPYGQIRRSTRPSSLTRTTSKRTRPAATASAMSFCPRLSRACPCFTSRMTISTEAQSPPSLQAL